MTTHKTIELQSRWSVLEVPACAPSWGLGRLDGAHLHTPTHFAGCTAVPVQPSILPAGFLAGPQCHRTCPAHPQHRSTCQSALRTLGGSCLAPSMHRAGARAGLGERGFSSGPFARRGHGCQIPAAYIPLSFPASTPQTHDLSS